MKEVNENLSNFYTNKEIYINLVQIKLVLYY